MNRCFWIGILLATLPLAAAEQKIAYIYSDQIIAGYQGMTEPSTALNKAKADFKATADSLNLALTRARSDFEAQKLLLSEEGKAAKNTEIEDLQRRYDSYVSEVYGPGGKLEQKSAELMAPVIDQIKAAVTKIAQTENFTLVFDAAESKLAILYAASGANLTGDVLDELNREFKPITPGAPVEKRYAVCPLYEANDEAQQENLGEQCRALIYEVVRSQPRTVMVTNTDLNGALLNRGVSGRANIGEQMSFAVGKDLQADYIFYGSVTKVGKKITITLNVADPRLNKAFPPETDDAARPEELRQVLGNITSKLLHKLPSQ